jgi:formylglycine-generating enzyme
MEKKPILEGCILVLSLLTIVSIQWLIGNHIQKDKVEVPGKSSLVEGVDTPNGESQTIMAQIPSGSSTTDGVIIPIVAVEMEMIAIPAGVFQMGDSFNEGGSEERPVHPVQLDSFQMCKYEITNGMYKDFLNAMYPAQLKVINGVVFAVQDDDNSYPYCVTSPSNSFSQIVFSNNTFSVRIKKGREMSNDPMVYVSWYGAVDFCNWLSQKEGTDTCYDLSTWQCDFTKKGYRLPTEAEWEYAARGGLSGKRFPWDDTISHGQANYQSNSTQIYDISQTRNYHPIWNDGIKPYTSPVGSFSPNSYGLYDMVGNVWEWCNDSITENSSFYGTTPYPHVNPTGPLLGEGRIARGGCWFSTADHCRVARRANNSPSRQEANVGFRVVYSGVKE